MPDEEDGAVDSPQEQAALSTPPLTAAMAGNVQFHKANLTIHKGHGTGSSDSESNSPDMQGNGIVRKSGQTLLCA